MGRRYRRRLTSGVGRWHVGVNVGVLVGGTGVGVGVLVGYGTGASVGVLVGGSPASTSASWSAAPASASAYWSAAPASTSAYWSAGFRGRCGCRRTPTGMASFRDRDDQTVRRAIGVKRPAIRQREVRTLSAPSLLSSPSSPSVTTGGTRVHGVTVGLHCWELAGTVWGR